jgi:hypothetical protein
MANPAIPREKLQLLLSVDAKQQLQRHCAFLDVSLTRYLERLAHNVEKRTLDGLTPEQGDLYRAGKLHRLSMTDVDRTAYLERIDQTRTVS